MPPPSKPVEAMSNVRRSAPTGEAVRTSMSRDDAAMPANKSVAPKAAVGRTGDNEVSINGTTINAARPKAAACHAARPA